MPLREFRYVVVEGPIGVGKTSLARRLADHAEAQPLLEQPQDNPFLSRFYEDPSRYALPAQLFFLFQRINEVRELAQMDLFRTRTVSDYLFDPEKVRTIHVDAVYMRWVMDEVDKAHDLLREMGLPVVTAD